MRAIKKGWRARVTFKLDARFDDTHVPRRWLYHKARGGTSNDFDKAVHPTPADFGHIWWKVVLWCPYDSPKTNLPRKILSLNYCSFSIFRFFPVFSLWNWYIFATEQSNRSKPFQFPSQYEKCVLNPNFTSVFKYQSAIISFWAPNPDFMRFDRVSRKPE